MNLDELAAEYNEAIVAEDKNAAHHKINEITKIVASNFPRDNPEKLAWFTAALQDKRKKWFVAKVMSKVNPIPKSLLQDMVLASMLEPNPSSNKFLVLPCVTTFGKEIVKEAMLKYSAHPQVVENDGFNKVAYWVGLRNA
jgi:hypothetical protein